MRPPHAISVLFLLVLIIGRLEGTAGLSTHLPNRKILQNWPRRGNNQNPNLAANTVRAQAATSQAIEQAVSDGASVQSTRRAGNVGSLTSWAAGQDQGTFEYVEQVTSPTFFGH